MWWLIGLFVLIFVLFLAVDVKCGTSCTASFLDGLSDIDFPDFSGD